MRRRSGSSRKSVLLRLIMVAVSVLLNMKTQSLGFVVISKFIGCLRVLLSLNLPICQRWGLIKGIKISILRHRFQRSLSTYHSWSFVLTKTALNVRIINLISNRESFNMNRILRGWLFGRERDRSERVLTLSSRFAATSQERLWI
jgi:hypothetical protein